VLSPFGQTPARANTGTNAPERAAGLAGRAGFIKLYVRKALALSADAAMRPAWCRHAGAPRMPFPARIRTFSK
jgi:hypothetical protein